MNKHTLIQAHIWLMLYSWLLAVPVAIGIAVWGRCKNKPWWPKAHMGIMLFGVVVPMTVGAAFGIVATEGFVARPHMIIGSIVSFGAWFQIILGVVNHAIFRVRGRGKDEGRPWHNSIHIWLGRVLLVLAVINIPIGIHMRHSGPSWYIGYGVWVGAGCIGAALLLYMTIRARSKQNLASENVSIVELPQPKLMKEER